VAPIDIKALDDDAAVALPADRIVDAIRSNPICALAVLQNGLSKSENEAHTFCL
jgi:hypothetical protein